MALLSKVWSLSIVSLYLVSGHWLCSRLSTLHWLLSLFLPLLISVHGYMRGSLDWSGACSAVFVGLWVSASGPGLFMSLLFFFLSSSRLTRWKEKKKSVIEGQNFKKGGQRDYIQVICNGAVLTLCAIATIVIDNEQHHHEDGETMKKVLQMAALTALATSNGDTWASEIGSVLSQSPRLITNGALVPAGTNGGVSLVGVAVSFLGGLTVGVAHDLGLFLINGDTQVSYFRIVFTGLAGLMGSLVDSLLGATLQFSGVDKKTGAIVEWPGAHVKPISGVPLLNNHAVNLLSTLITASITASMTPYILS